MIATLNPRKPRPPRRGRPPVYLEPRRLTNFRLSKRLLGRLATEARVKDTTQVELVSAALDKFLPKHEDPL